MTARAENLTKWLSNAEKALGEGLKTGQYVHPSDATNLNNSTRNDYYRMCSCIGEYQDLLKEELSLV